MAAEKEEAQAPFKSNFVQLGRNVWFTLESSFRADGERAAALDDRLQGVGDQVKQTAEMGISWMQLGDWEQRRTWTDDEWVAFLRMWQNYGGYIFDEELLTEQEKKLFNAFMVYWTFYACVPSKRPEGAPDDLTMEAAGEKVDVKLEAFHERLGDPLEPCAACQKNALGYKLLRCSRCKRAHYCGRDCQAKHWRQGHKRECTATSE